MGRIKEINMKNRTYYFYDDMINYKNFDSNLLIIHKKSSKKISIYYIGYITKKYKYAINSVNPLYLIVNKVDGFIKEKGGNKYLNFAFTDKNSEVLKKYADIWSGIKTPIEKINSGKSGEYRKDYMKIKINSDDYLLLNKQLKFINLTIIVRAVFDQDNKYYPQIFLDEWLYEL